MRSSEPNTNKFEPEQGSVYSERCVGDQHYVCVVNPDQPNPERVRGFPVEIDVEEGEMMQVRTFLMMTVDMFPPPPKSDQGSDREQAPKRPRDVADEKVAPGPGIRMTRMIRMVSCSTEHPRTGGKPFVSRGHRPYDRGCDACVQARGKTPARGRKQKAEESGQTAEYQLAADSKVSTGFLCSV